MKLLDTNVFVYAAGAPGPFKEPCLAILDDARAHSGGYGLDVETLQEILEIYSRRGHRGFAVQMVNEALVSFPAPFPITREEVEEATDIFKGHRRLSPRDAIHAAVVIVHRLEGIVSADRGFERVSGIVRFDPRGFASR